jgi:hypothetical protein
MLVWTTTTGLHKNTVLASTYPRAVFFSVLWITANLVVEGIRYFFCLLRLDFRVARWFVSKPNIRIWINFVGSCNGRCWYILWTLGPFYSLLLYFMGICYILWSFWYIFLALVFFAKKNLATLLDSCTNRNRKVFQQFVC